MTTWKILLTDGLEEKGQAILREHAQVDDRVGISAEDLLKVVGDYDALIVRGRTKVTPAVFEVAPKLKVVGRAGVGVDNIDLTAARARGVTVVNSPKATTQAVAELTFGLMLGLAREIPRADASMKAGKWLKKGFEGTELNGKTLGVIGYGRIGTAVSGMARAFQMRVVAYDPRIDADKAEKYNVAPVTLDELYARSDIITLHVPLNDETRGMINADALAKMKAGVQLVCAARGGVVVEADLLAALESGRVAAAALDVFSSEPPGDDPLVAHPHVVCTPHIGAQTVEAQARASVDISTEVLAALRGETLRWKVA